MIIYFRLSCFLFKIQILLIKISRQQVISYFLDRYWLIYGPSKTKCQKRPFQKLHKYLFFDFFSKNQQIDVKSVEEYNFNLF
jgi:hypothetical protein